MANFVQRQPKERQRSGASPEALNEASLAAAPLDRISSSFYNSVKVWINV